MTDDRSGDLLARWREGDPQAAEKLFSRYASQLSALAQDRLSERIRRRVDPEDVVQSVYRSFFASAGAGRYDLQRGGDLWRLLVVITLQKLRRQVELHTASKRAVAQEQTFGSEDSLVRIQGYFKGREPSPLEAVALADELEQVMEKLGPIERRILEWRLQGYNLEEIATASRRSERTISRVLAEIKVQLEQRRARTLGR